MKKHKLLIFSAAGDTAVAEWEVGNEKQEEVARGAFDQAVSEGWGAVSGSSEGATALDGFDPGVEEIFLLRPIAGG